MNGRGLWRERSERLSDGNVETGLLFLVFDVTAALSLHVICHLIEYLAHLVYRCGLAYIGRTVCKLGSVKRGAVAVT